MNRIDAIPDDVLLGIFDFYVYVPPSHRVKCKKKVEAWQSLVHVCRRWRNLVLASPRRLNLRLFCTHETPVKDRLDVWPALPLIVSGNMESSRSDNVIAALGQSNRVCLVNLILKSWSLEKVLGTMQVPFPELTDLRLSSYAPAGPPVILDSFLDGSAPRLRSFNTHNIIFLGFPKLLLSANHLIYLALRTNGMPNLGYISPEAMIDLLSVLSSLKTLLCLEFRTFQRHPDWDGRSLPPPKHSIPSLREFRFTGVPKYLEQVVTHIDAPQLNEMHISFVNQFNYFDEDFDCPRLAQFINRTPTLGARDGAHVQFATDDRYTRVTLLACSSALDILTSCRLADFVRGFCNSSLHPLSTVEDLYIRHQRWHSPTQNTAWLQFLLLFTAVKNLYLSKEFAPGVAGALQELVGGRITEVLPSLQKIFVEALEPSGSGPFQENIGQFVAARQLSDHPVVISDWAKDSKMKLM